MTDIDRTLDRITALYAPLSESGPDVPLALQSRQFAFLAKDYISAASTLEQAGPQHWLPRVQLTGLALELALKACLASVSTDPPPSHDLVALCKHVVKLGFELDDPAGAAIVHVHHVYYSDVATGTRYKARYPSKSVEHLGGSLPVGSTYEAIVTRLLEQATSRSEV
jgi:hypothetical protein